MNERVEFETKDGRHSVRRDRILGIGESKVVGSDTFTTMVTCGSTPLEITTPYPEACERVWPSQAKAPPVPGMVWKRPGEAGRVDGRYYLCVYKGVIGVFRWYGSDISHDGWNVEGVTAWLDFEIPTIPDWAKGGQ